MRSVNIRAPTLAESVRGSAAGTGAGAMTVSANCGMESVGEAPAADPVVAHAMTAAAKRRFMWVMLPLADLNGVEP